MGDLEAAQERSGEWSGDWSGQAVWRLVAWLGKVVKGSGLEAGRQELSGDFSRNGLEAGRASWSQSSLKEVVWRQMEGSGLGIPKNQKRDPSAEKNK